MKYDYLITKLKSLVANERKITAEIVELIREIDQKRVYIEYGHTSMFALLTKDFGYAPASAMRRIDAARLSKEIPELNDSLKAGEINLSQVSMLAQAVRQKQKEISKYEINENEVCKNKVKLNERRSKAQVSKETKVALLEQVKSLDLIATQKALAKSLDLEIQTHEKKIYQKDESVYVGITLTKELQQDLERVKELISHQHPNPTMAELFQFLANHFLNSKDPLRQKNILIKNKAEKNNTEIELKLKMTDKSRCKESDYSAAVPASRQRYIPIKTKQQIFQRDQCCQWITENKNNRGEIKRIKCGSKFHLQIDHIQPRWQDGGNAAKPTGAMCSSQ